MIRNLLLVLFLAVLSTACAHTSLVQDAVNRTVVVHSATSGFCAGFVVKTNQVLTAKHCEGLELTVNGKAATILKESKADVILLGAEIQTVGTAQMNFFPHEGDETHEVFIHPQLGRLVSFGRVVQVTSQEVMHSSLSIPGSSGSALLDAKGRLIGINVRYHYVDLPSGQTITLMNGMMQAGMVKVDAIAIVVGGAVPAKAAQELLTK